jgi:hypothetical protein
MKTEDWNPTDHINWNNNFERIKAKFTDKKDIIIMMEECYDLFRDVIRRGKVYLNNKISICLLGIRLAIEGLENYPLVADIGRRLIEIGMNNLGRFFETYGLAMMNNNAYKPI